MSPPSQTLPESAVEKTIKKQLNEYLAAEYGFEDETQVSDHWPFELHLLGTISLPDHSMCVFEFWDGTASNFAFAGQSLGCFATEGMSFDQFRLLVLGSRWIRSRQPVDLNTSRVGDGVTPAVYERRAAIQELAAQAWPDDHQPRILEGLFLQQTRAYLALVERAASREQVVVGSGIEPQPVHLTTGSAWQKLAFGIGEMIAAGKLELS